MYTVIYRFHLLDLHTIDNPFNNAPVSFALAPPHPLGLPDI